MQTRELLEKFLSLLEQENRYLIESVNNKEASAKLFAIVEQKEELLKEILALDKEALAPFVQELQKIDELTQRNRALAINNMEFVNEIFDAIYSQYTPTQYTKDGNISQSKEGIFNKKA